MAEEVVKETTVQTSTTGGSSEAPVVKEAKVEGSRTASYLVYFIFGLVDILLMFRFVFKLAGANPGSPFVSFIYSLTQIFVVPFVGIFRRGVTQGVETTAVLEPETLVAMAVYGVLAWGISYLIVILTKHQPD